MIIPVHDVASAATSVPDHCWLLLAIDLDLCNALFKQREVKKHGLAWIKTKYVCVNGFISRRWLLIGNNAAAMIAHVSRCY